MMHHQIPVDSPSLPDNLKDIVFLPFDRISFLPGFKHPDEWMIEVIHNGIQAAVASLPLDKVDYPFLQALKCLGRSGQKWGGKPA